MIDKGHCWKCFKPVNIKANILCDDCHKKEMINVHKNEEKIMDYEQGRPFLFRRPHGSGRRIIRKSEPLAG